MPIECPFYVAKSKSPLSSHIMFSGSLLIYFRGIILIFTHPACVVLYGHAHGFEGISRVAFYNIKISEKQLPKLHPKG